MWVDEVEDPEAEVEPDLWRPLTPGTASNGGQAATGPKGSSAPGAGKHALKGAEGARSTAPAASGPKVTLHFSVRDTGIGISTSDLGRLFSSFTQVRPLLT